MTVRCLSSALERVFQRAEQGLFCLREVPGLELGVALEGGEPYWGEPGEPVR